MAKSTKSNRTNEIQGTQLAVPAKNKNGSATKIPSKEKATGGRNELSDSLQTVSNGSTDREEQKITLKYFSPQAQLVQVAGNFNGWQPASTPLKNTGIGEWYVDLSLRSGQYEYQFVVDGQWREDPQAAQREMNPYGGFNSILTVPAGGQALIS